MILQIFETIVIGGIAAKAIIAISQPMPAASCEEIAQAINMSTYKAECLVADD